MVHRKNALTSITVQEPNLNWPIGLCLDYRVYQAIKQNNEFVDCDWVPDFSCFIKHPKNEIENVKTLNKKNSEFFQLENCGSLEGWKEEENDSRKNFCQVSASQCLADTFNPFFIQTAKI